MCHLLFFAADVRVSESDANYIKRRTALLDLVFRDADPAILQALSGGTPLHNICNWEDHDRDLQMFNQLCSMHRIISLSFIGFETIGPIHYEYLPADLERLTMYACKQAYPLDTRLLPRDLRYLDFSRNRLTGSVSLQTLPQHLERLELTANRLGGPIYLRNLPKTIQYICLLDNKIAQRVVECDPLPPYLTTVDLRYNKIRKVQIWKDHNGNYGGASPLKELFPAMNCVLV